MGSKGRALFDLNEPPAEDEQVNDGVLCLQPQRAVPSSSTNTSEFLASAVDPPRIVNNHAFSHASSVSGFQPFVRSKGAEASRAPEEHGSAGPSTSGGASLSKSSQEHTMKSLLQPDLNSLDMQVAEKEEGEWSDAEGSTYADKNCGFNDKSNTDVEKASQEKSAVESVSNSDKVGSVDNASHDNEKRNGENYNISSLELDRDTSDRKSNSSRNSETSSKADIAMDGQEDSGQVPKHREIRGVEASHALKCANNFGKRPKVDQQKEAMLGKKRSRQTMFLDLEDVKQAGSQKSIARRQNFPAPVTTRIVKESRNVPPPSEKNGEKHSQVLVKDVKQIDSTNEGNLPMESNDSRSESSADVNLAPLGRPRRLNSATDLTSEAQTPPLPRQSSWKHPTDQRQNRNSQLSGRKPALTSQNSMEPKLGAKKPPSKKQPIVSSPCQDTSVERLIREVTNEKFWQHPDEAELQCVPGQFESVEEYVKVFEPLLFEECRAQLYSTWEEMADTGTHVRVHIKNIERRERGWYDVILFPDCEWKWLFKEGDVAVLSTPRPGSVRSRRSGTSTFGDGDEPEISGRVAGTVRRHIPIDTRDPAGAILHFYVGDPYDTNSNIGSDHILRKLQPRGIWFLTVLGSLATTQREYVALHAFRRLNLQMQNAILQPSPEHFPKYEEQTPAMPDCFTPNFTDHLHRTFNEPQLAAIQWAATHTAAGTNGMTKRQDPWPFTLVQGPPGTGKTHTVWGMLNVIHLVQYQHYYTALLKKLAPESYKQNNENNSDNVVTGSIDEVLLSMDQNLFRTLPKLCPKPRMLVCAPSNAATDELLARVLDRGFIDGEMKVYRPDVARVGVDSQTRAAQAVSVERRTEQLLMKSRDEVYGWMHQLRAREAQLSQQIAGLQRELTVAAAAGRAQGSVGVDPDVLMARDQNRDTLLQNLAAVVENRDKILVEMSRLLILESRFRGGNNFNMEEARASLEASFANEAEIVFTTVSSSGRKLCLLIIGLAMVLVIRYSSVEKSYSIVEKSDSSVEESPKKQSVYGFFNDHPDINEGSKDENAKSSDLYPIELVTFKEKPHLIDVEGLNDLYNMNNFSTEESNALLAWGKMRLLLSRSDGLNGTAQGVKEAAISWKDLVSFIEKSKAQDEKENEDCPYSVTAFNPAMSKDGSSLRIPCGLVEDSSITVIGIPDAKQEGFQIELVGSKLLEETKPPIVLNYKVILPGENLTKDPLITQNSWTNESGWGKVEKCPDHGSTDMIKVDGLVKCNAKIFRYNIEETANMTNTSHPKSSDVSNSSAYGTANYPFLEGNPFTATLWAGIEGFHMTVNGRHETSFAYREKLEPWLVSGVNVIGGVDTISILAKGLPVSNDFNLGYDVEQLKAPLTPKKRLVMLIGVFSTGNNFERRMALRKSWMQYEAVRSGEVAVRFFIGLDKNRQVNFELWKEAQAYGDIQLLPFVDYYSLLTVKTIAICIMGVKILPAKYVMKTDDDAFVRIDEVLSSLKGKDPNGLLYGGISFESTPHRDKENKWYISPEEYPPAFYPPWAHGPGYIISRDIAKFIVQGHQEMELMLFKLEDVAVGIWVEEFRRKGHKVQYVNDERFYNAGCDSGYVLAHYQNPRMVLCLWEKLQKEHEPNCCE